VAETVAAETDIRLSATGRVEAVSDGVMTSRPG
jgi:hypothetical protein